MSTFTFAIVAKSDNPIYELVVSPKKEEPTVNQQNQFFLHAVRSTPTCFASICVDRTLSYFCSAPLKALDIVDEELWKTNNMFLKVCTHPSKPTRNQQCLSSAPQTVCDPNPKLQSSRLRTS
jgi:hypothetical protein